MVTPLLAEQTALGNSAPVSFVNTPDFGRQVVSSATPLPVVNSLDRASVYSSGVVNFTPAALATDIIALAPQSYGRTTFVESVTISGTATSASVLDVLLQRSTNAGGGTSAAQPTGYADKRDITPTSLLYSYSVNRTSNGNGIDAIRTLHGAFKLYLGTASVPVSPVTITFAGNKKPSLRDLSEWFVINLNGQTIPAGTSLDIGVTWSEKAIPPTIFAGDSTTSNATYLFNQLGMSGDLNAVANVKNRGSNGMTLENVVLNTSTPAYPLTTSTGLIGQLGGGNTSSVIVVCYGLNDFRQGATTVGRMIALLDATIYAILNGTTASAVYTSPMGDNSSVTWAHTTTGNPDAKIILWGPNSVTSDDPGATGFITLTGRWSAMTLAQAAQQMTDDMYNAYAAFASDSRIFRLVQKQDVFGRTVKTNAANGRMTDILHPNQKGQAASAKQIAPHVYDALQACNAEMF